MSVRRYQQQQDTVENPRAAEHRALLKVTGMLLDGAKKGGRELIEACYYNRKLWGIFLTDCVDPGNQLPDPIKANIVSLALWVQGYSNKVLGGASVQPLVDVNRSIIEGLRPPSQPTMEPARPASTSATPIVASA